MDAKTIIFIGKSGSGKGTQAELLKEKLSQEGDVFHLESGARFREFIAENKSHTADLAREINDRGELQPQFLSVWIWSNDLVNNLEKDTSLILDGTPRRIDEAKVLESAFNFYGRENIYVFHLEVSDDVTVNRLKNRGRNDDIDESDVREKLRWFEADVVPVIDYYTSNDYYHFYKVDGEKTEEEIHQEVLDILKI